MIEFDYDLALLQKYYYKNINVNLVFKKSIRMLYVIEYLVFIVLICMYECYIKVLEEVLDEDDSKSFCRGKLQNNCPKICRGNRKGKYTSVPYALTKHQKYI